MDMRKFFGKQAAKPAAKKVTTVKLGKKTFSRIVRKAAKASHEEVKHVSKTVENQVGHNSPIGNADAVPLIPKIVQGNDDLNRIGNRIYARGLYVKGRIGATVAAQSDNRPLMVRVMVLSQRNVKDSTQIPSSFADGQLLSANDTAAGLTNVPFDGSPRTSMYPVNKDMFVVHYQREFKLTPDIDGNVITPGTYGVEGNAGSSRRFGCKVRIPRNLMYFGSTSEFPQNSAPFIVIGYYYPDGTTPDNVQTRITSSVVSTLYYTDA